MKNDKYVHGNMAENTIFDEYSAIARSAYIENAGVKNLHVLNMMSLSLDLPDKDYGW